MRISSKSQGLSSHMAKANAMHNMGTLHDNNIANFIACSAKRLEYNVIKARGCKMSNVLTRV